MRTLAGNRSDTTEPTATGRAGNAEADPGDDAGDGAGGVPPTEAEVPVATAPAQPVHAPIPLVALVLGVAGVALGLTVIWFFAAIPTGVAAVVVGFVAHRRVKANPDPRARSRAVIGGVLGLVAILLGITGAIFVPRVMDRADRFLGSVQQDVNDDVGLINGGLQQDVDRLDRTLTRDLNRFERQNREDVAALERRTAATLATLETRLGGDLKTASAAAKADLTVLETQLRSDLDALEEALRTTEATVDGKIAALDGKITALDARITRIERDLGI